MFDINFFFPQYAILYLTLHVTPYIQGDSKRIEHFQNFSTQWLPLVTEMIADFKCQYRGEKTMEVLKFGVYWMFMWSWVIE